MYPLNMCSFELFSFLGLSITSQVFPPALVERKTLVRKTLVAAIMNDSPKPLPLVKEGMGLSFQFPNDVSTKIQWTRSRGVVETSTRCNQVFSRASR